jgi:anti-sigma regulatory factor (Ser/Thr protein kinase)
MSDLMLCVTELVTNSVQHLEARGDDIELAVRVSSDQVRVEVGDRGEGFVLDRVVKERGAGGGWGLYIVDLLADRWGIDRRDLTWVWVEIDLGGPGAPP